MSVWVVSYGDKNTYENERLSQCFAKKQIDHRFVAPWEVNLVVSDSEANILIDGESLALPDLTLVRYGAGIGRSSVGLIRQTELLGIPTFNSSASICMAKDKLVTSQILANAGIPVPKTIPVDLPANLSADTIRLIEEQVGMPCVVKLVTGSYGEGVHLCRTANDLKSLLSMLDVVARTGTVLVQEYLGHRVGEDVRVLIVDGELIGAMKRTAPAGDFRANISGGGTGEPHGLSVAGCTIALNAAKALGLTIAGIDLLFTEDGYAVCEANSNPGFVGFERYCNVDVADKITNFVLKNLK